MTFRTFKRSLAVSLTTLCMAMSAQADTLADALVGAYNTSGLLEQNRAVLRAADEGVAQAVSALRPVISWSADVAREFGTTRNASSAGRIVGSASNTTSIGLVGELTLFDYGQNRLAIESAKESVLATRDALLSIEQQILLRAVSAFMEVRRATENVSLRQNNLRLIDQELRAARDRFEVGEVTRTDVALAEARLAEARANLAAAQGALDIAREEYRVATGRNPGTVTPPRAVPALPSSTAAATSLAMRAHPDLSRAQRLVTIDELSIQRAKAAMKPTVTLNGSIGVTENFDNRNFSRGGSVGVQAGGPIYQGGRLSSLVRQAMADRDASRSNLLLVRLGIEQDVTNALVQFNTARASIDASANQVRAARVAFQGVREEATLGARTTLDVLNAEQELLNAQTTLISATVDEYIAAYAVLAAMGQLTARQLGLNVQQYDPTQYYNLVKDAPVVSRQGEQLNRVLRALGKE